MNLTQGRSCVIFLALCVCAALVRAQVPNDDCPRAQQIGLGYWNGDTSSATVGPAGCIGQTSRDVWFSFTPPCDGNYIFSLCNGAGWDNVLTVYSSCPQSGGSVVGCADDTCGVDASLTVGLYYGVTYTIRLGGFAAQHAGPFTLTVSMYNANNAAGNDTCVTPWPISIGRTFGSNGCANGEGVANCVSSSDNDV